ncbi:helix-hairpin-helix domain-containing protein [Patescibacteria group bacterium]|nr:helix-hairpin-helix domain-containing protein [Patescibacteria group bacterium]
MFDDSSDISMAFQQIRKQLSVRLVIQAIIFLLGISISSFGLFQLFSNDAQASQKSRDFEVVQVCEKDPEFGRLTVDVGGAVKNPGVYQLDSGSRINDLINIAGGFSNSVDKYYINKVLNLSQRLNDGEKLYIPTIEESIEVQTKLENQQTGDDSAVGVLGIISINSATKEQLMSLTGIGEKRAEDIISNRPYDSLIKLVEKSVLTELIFENIKNAISL